MGYATLAARSLRPVELSADDAYQFDRLAYSLLDETVFEYDRFVTDDRRTVNASQWRQWRQDDEIVIYRERRGSDDYTTLEPQDETGASVRLTAFHGPAPMTESKAASGAMPRLLAVGSLDHSLDDVMYGIVTPTAGAMRLRAAYTSNNDYIDGAVLCPIRSPTPSEPFQFLGIKWMLQRGHGAGIVRPRDFVYLESTGVQIRQDGSGQRVGYHIMHSVDLPECTSMSLKVQRGAFTTCYLYHELANGTVDVYMTAVVQPRGNLVASMAVRAAAAMLTSNWRALSLFAENKKLAWLLETHRQLQRPSVSAGTLASRCGLCAKSFKGFTNRNKKRFSCQLCEMTVCAECSMTRTLRSEGFARDSIVTTDMPFCKKCIALAGEESASEIARQQLWETEIVRTGRANTQTALALARRDPSISGTINERMYRPSHSLENGLVDPNGYRPHDDIRSTWHDADTHRRHSHFDPSVRASVATAQSRRGSSSPTKKSFSGGRRTMNTTWNSSGGRPTESLSIGALNDRNSSFQDLGASRLTTEPDEDQDEAGRNSTTSSALVLLEDHKTSRRMKALDYIPKPDDTASAIMARSSLASSSVYTETRDYEVESVYSQTSSIAVLDLEPHAVEPTMAKPVTIVEEEEPHEPQSELEAFYLEQRRQQELQQQQLRQRQVKLKQFERKLSRSSMILLDPSQQPQQPPQPPRPSRVRFDEGDFRDADVVSQASTNMQRLSMDESDPQSRLSYQMQLWLQMNELRDTAESTYKITQRNGEAIASHNPNVARNVRAPSQRPPSNISSRRPPTTGRQSSYAASVGYAPVSRPSVSSMSSARRSQMPVSY